MLDAPCAAVHCPVSQQSRSLNEINGLADVYQDVMVRRSSARAVRERFQFWG
jgi:hypothetical protein